MKFKYLLGGVTILATSLSIAAITTMINEKPIDCYVFKGETLAMKGTCKADRGSLASGGEYKLKWPDGIITFIALKVDGGRAPVCPIDTQMAIDRKECRPSYLRSAKTLKRIKETERTDTSITCVQLKDKSICWGGWR